MDWHQLGSSEDGGLYDKALFGDREPILLRQVVGVCLGGWVPRPWQWGKYEKMLFEILRPFWREPFRVDIVLPSTDGMMSFFPGWLWGVQALWPPIEFMDHADGVILRVEVLWCIDASAQIPLMNWSRHVENPVATCMWVSWLGLSDWKLIYLYNYSE